MNLTDKYLRRSQSAVARSGSEKGLVRKSISVGELYRDKSELIPITGFVPANFCRVLLQSLRDRLSLLVSEAGSWKAEYWPGIPSTEIFVQWNLTCPENFRVSPPSCFHLPKPKETTYRATTVSARCFTQAYNHGNDLIRSIKFPQ